ncbi:MAG: hypothetical protein A2Y24_08380 [Clostridiales bacterium GWE2_32_10]|nr:MAG: hypothetical protein A2Y24_08380 [Clostridiales bacterium GWE2_32_10]HBY19692.1 hypothetical protein [Clostridiales bacterium]
MLTVVKNYIKLLYKYKVLNISASMEYKVSFILQIVLMILNNASFLIVWGALFTVNKSIGGYEFKDVMLLWAISSSSFGFCYVLFGNGRKVMSLIINGELDVYLLQPKNLLFNVLVSETSISAIGDILYGYIILIILGADIKLWAMFSLFVVVSGIIMAMFGVIIHSLTFYLNNIKEFINNMEMLAVSFSIYPEGIFGGFVKLLLYTVIPTGFMVYIPVSVMRQFDMGLFLEVIAFAVFETIAAIVIFNSGLKRYGSGNMMNMRG